MKVELGDEPLTPRKPGHLTNSTVIPSGPSISVLLTGACLRDKHTFLSLALSRVPAVQGTTLSSTALLPDHLRPLLLMVSGKGRGVGGGVGQAGGRSRLQGDNIDLGSVWLQNRHCDLKNIT